MASRRELLDSLKPGMHLDKNFFLKIYGYDITRPGFADDVIRRLEILGCSKARDYYTCIVSEYNHKHNQEMKRVSEWYAKQDIDERGVRESRKQKNTASHIVEHLRKNGVCPMNRKQTESMKKALENRKTDLQQRSDKELLILLQKLKSQKTTPCATTEQLDQ